MPRTAPEIRAEERPSISPNSASCLGLPLGWGVPELHPPPPPLGVMAGLSNYRCFTVLSVGLLVCFPEGMVQGGGILRGDLEGGSGVSRGWRGGKGTWERNVEKEQRC